MDFGFPRRVLSVYRAYARGRPGLDTNGSDDEVRPKESDPIQP